MKSELTSTKFQLNPSQNKAGPKVDFDPKTNNDVITGEQW